MAWERIEKSKELAMNAVLDRSFRRIKTGAIGNYELSGEFGRAVVVGSRARLMTEKILILTDPECRRDPDERSRFGGLAEISGIMHEMDPNVVSRFWRKHLKKCDTLTDFEIEVCENALKMNKLPDNKFFSELKNLPSLEGVVAMGLRIAQKLSSTQITC
jgi:hypothetical protein